MDIKAELLKAFSKANAVRIALAIGSDQELFDALVILVLQAENRIAARAAWVMRHCYDDHPWLVEKHIPAMIKRLEKPACDAVKRNMLAILKDIDIPEALEGQLLNSCFIMLNDRSEPVAIKMFSMVVLFNLALKYPDIKHELADTIRTQMPYSTPGFKNRGEKILQHLARL